MKEDKTRKKHPLLAHLCPGCGSTHSQLPPGPGSQPESGFSVRAPAGVPSSLEPGVCVCHTHGRGALSSCCTSPTLLGVLFLFCFVLFSPPKPTLFLRVLGPPCLDSFGFRASYIPISISYVCGVHTANSERDTRAPRPPWTTGEKPT